MSPKNYAVIMAGGGLMGCATAYYLLKADPTLQVAIVEMDATYEKNSSVLSDGNVRLQFNLKENIQISQFGMEVMETFAEDMAVDGVKPDLAFRKQGNLFLTDEENLGNAQAGFNLQDSMNCGVEWLNPAEVVARFPLFSTNGIAGGTFGNLDGTLDPHALLMAYKNKAVDLGAEFIEAEVAAIEQTSGRVTGVVLASGENLHSKFVVNSAGAWGTKLARTVGVELPIDPVMRQVFILETAANPEEIYPLTVFPTGLYLVQEHANRWMCGQSFDDDPVGFDFHTNRDVFMDKMWPDLVSYAPAFDRLKVTGAWAGLYAVNTFDGNVILGEWPELEGLMLTNGFSGHGLQQCHAVGRYLAELMLGHTPKLDLSIFSPQRLFDNQPVFEGHGKLV